MGSRHNWRTHHSASLRSLLDNLLVLAGRPDGHFAVFAADPPDVVLESDSLKDECSYTARKCSDERDEWIRGDSLIDLDGKRALDGRTLRLCATHFSDLDSPRWGLRDVLISLVEILEKDFEAFDCHLRLLRELSLTCHTPDETTLDFDSFQRLLFSLPALRGSIHLGFAGEELRPNVVFQRADSLLSPDFHRFIRWLRDKPRELNPDLLLEARAYGAKVVVPSELLPGLANAPVAAEDVRETPFVIANCHDGDVAHCFFLLFGIPENGYDVSASLTSILGAVLRKREKVAQNLSYFRALIPEELEAELSSGLSVVPEINKQLRGFLASWRYQTTSPRKTISTLVDGLAKHYCSVARIQLPAVQRLLNAFERREKELHGMSGYREHFAHELVVYLIGMEILRKLERSGANLTALFADAYNGSFDGASVEAYWFLTAFLHDIAYPVSKANGHLATAARELHIPPALMSSYHMQYSRDTLAAKLSPVLLDIARTVSRCTGGKGGTTRAVRSRLESCLLDSPDHGILSAVVALELSGKGTPRKQMAPIASAIATHSNRLLLPKEAKEVFDPPSLASSEIQLVCKRKQQLRQSLSFHRNPLAGLLIYCDALHDWARIGDIQEAGDRTGLRISVDEKQKVRASIQLGTVPDITWEGMKREKTLVVNRVSPSGKWTIELDAKREKFAA